MQQRMQSLSSANLQKSVNSVKKVKLFMQISNKNGPRTEPCGTPCKSLSQELQSSRIFVLYHALER